MSNPTGVDAQSAQDEEDRESELLCLKIKAQLEDLFSDSHLARDSFLLKHVLKNKQGYVSLKLLTCLKKIKVLTRDWYMTLAGAAHSDILELNDECTKVRRIEPLPKQLLCSPTSRLLLIWNLSVDKTEEDLEHPSLSEGILRKFCVYGSITAVWILHPDKELPKELQCYAKRHKELSQHFCAVVKFGDLEAVRKAYSALKAEEEKSNGEGMCVAPLGFHQSIHHFTKDQPSEENHKDRPENPLENPLETSEDSVQKEPSSPVKVTHESADTSQHQESSDNSIQRTSQQVATSCSGQSAPDLFQSYSRRSLCSGDFDKNDSQSPWVLRRKLAASAPCLMQRALRQPFGPNGTKGFWGTGEPLNLPLHDVIPPMLNNGGRFVKQM
uniref:la-related protein 6-like n=1 Tax=Scatophagus argus TaxID=75038 RepID=UPI001ED80B3C|nr:la-related protein 6-like [Scatophagus argus]